MHLYIRIVSLFAMCDPARSMGWTAEGHNGWSWEGTVAYEEDAALPEAIFRDFNRVTEADDRRLASWGYRLPSLSVGDIIAYKRSDAPADMPYDVWSVDSFGFTQILPGLGPLHNTVALEEAARQMGVDTEDQG